MNLVRNADFSVRGPGGVPAGWAFVEPKWRSATAVLRPGAGGVGMGGRRGNPWVVGRLEQTIEGVKGGAAYEFLVRGSTAGVGSPFRTVIVRVMWLSDSRPVHRAGTLLRGPRMESSSAFVFREVLEAPEEADALVLSLEVKWPGEDGIVTWEQVAVRESTPSGPRMARVGTVYLCPKGGTPESNRERFAGFVDDAGRCGLDIVCLPEGLTVVGTGRTYADCAETVPGPTTEVLGRAARANGIWVVAGLYEKVGDVLYNTAVLLDRNGRVAGTYRKTHLPREEWRQGITPGQSYPVFETDFSIIGIQICYDWFFPEVTELLALQGAEIVFAPTWGNTWPDEGGRVEGETTFRVRARDNGVWMVPSVYSGNSLIIDPLGRIVASSDGRDGLVSAEIDLSRREALPWVGCWRDIGPRDRMPETYAELTRPPCRPKAFS